MHLKTLPFYIAIGVLSAIAALPCFADGGNFSTIDCPGATQSFAQSINTTGQIVGICYVNGNQFGFATSPDGSLQMLSAGGSTGTVATDINDGGTVVGDYSTTDFFSHGFVFSNGVYTTFDPPGSVGTFPAGINAGGVVAGSYTRNNGNTYGFVRDALGYFTSFEVPDFTYLAVTGINDSGEITGYGDVGAMVLGFVREPQGSIVTFEVPGTTRTLPAAINNAGQITGWAFDKNNEGRAFTRSALGDFITFTAGPAGSGSVFAHSLNDRGEIVGSGLSSGNVAFSFAKSGSETPISFQDPSASVVCVCGTTALKINSLGEIVGFYYDSEGQAHGFSRSVLP